jgi:hypothetical protein
MVRILFIKEKYVVGELDIFDPERKRYRMIRLSAGTGYARDNLRLIALQFRTGRDLTGDACCLKQ